MSEQIKIHLDNARNSLVEASMEVKTLELKSNQHKVLRELASIIESIDKAMHWVKLKPVSIPEKKLEEIFDEMSEPEVNNYKIMALRLEPQSIKGTKINGYLKTYHLPTSIPDIIEDVGYTYGGGKYQIRIVDGVGKYVKSKTFEISGLPKIPKIDKPNNKDDDEDGHDPVKISLGRNRSRMS